MNDIDKIKDLLFGHEKKALDAITRRLEIPESRTADIADVLPESILRSHADKRLVSALQDPVEQCVKQSIIRDPEDFADTLFPVIGPAIRKSIAEALRTMVQSLNQTMESSLSLQTRYQAWRAGVPLGQFILQRNILYRVEQAFLIRRHDGLLIDQKQHDDIKTKDSDAVSAMFTAIQDFIQDSFSQGGNESLTTAVLGDLTLWAVHGPKAILVCVIRGVAQPALRTQLREILEQIHLRHGEALDHFDGAKPIPGIALEVEKCLVLQQQKDAAKSDSDSDSEGGGLPFPVILFLLAAAILTGWYFFHRHLEAKQLEGFRLALDNTPGIVVNEIQRDGDNIVVRGLRDPLSSAPADLAPALLIDQAQLVMNFASFQSLDAAIVERRARRILKPPPGVGMTLEGHQLRLSGSASVAWKKNAQALAVAVPGVDLVDLSRMSINDEEILAALISELQPPDTATLDVRDGSLRASGYASQAWLLEARRRLPSVAGVLSGDLQGIAVEEKLRLSELLSLADGANVFFARNDIFLAGQDAVLNELTLKIRQIVSLAASLNSAPQISILGYSDGTGSAELNRTVELARADRVARWLIDGGISPDIIQTRAVGVVAGVAAVQPEMRRAEIKIGVLTSR